MTTNTNLRNIRIGDTVTGTTADGPFTGTVQYLYRNYSRSLGITVATDTGSVTVCVNEDDGIGRVRRADSLAIVESARRG